MISAKVFFGIILALSFVCGPHAVASVPDEIMTEYKAYATALDNKDNAAAKKHSFAAWQAAEEHLGDHRSTGDLALNYASIAPTGKEKNPYKNYEKRVKAYDRAIELSHFYGDEAGVTEVKRRIALADLEMTVNRYRESSFGFSRANTKSKKSGKLNPIEKVERAIDEHGLRGTSYDGDLNVLYARYYQLNDKPHDAIEYGEKAIEIYDNRTDDNFSKYTFFIRLFKGNSHYDLGTKNDDIEEKIKAALEYQVVMQNLEDVLPAKHPFVKTAFSSWMKTRSDIEEDGALEQAEEAGLCECWPYENYKNKAVPLTRKPPKMPGSARTSGHVYVKFDVDNEGAPENISVVSSSHKLFEKSAMRSVERWEYSKREEGVDPENRKDITTKISFRLSDRSGNIIPE